MRMRSSPSVSTISTVCPALVRITRRSGGLTCASAGAAPSGYQTPTQMGLRGSPASNSTQMSVPAGGTKKCP